MSLVPTISKIIRLILFWALLVILQNFACADPPYNVCSSTVNFTHNNSFKNNLNILLPSLYSNADVSNFNTTSIGNNPNTVYGLFLCYKYVSNLNCETCLSLANQDILNLCPNNDEAIVWQEDCQLRYSNQKFLGHLDVTENIPKYNAKNVSEIKRFTTLVNETLNNLTRQAAFDSSLGMYATGEAQFSAADTIYALVQCTPDLSPGDCETCLKTAITNISSCCNFSIGARLLSRSCYLRYEFYPFYQNATGNSSGDYKNTAIVVVFAVGSSILVVAFLVSSICYIARRNRRRRERQISIHEAQLHDYGGANDIDYHNQNLHGMKNLNLKELPLIDIETISTATNDFSDLNKLGEGGFGPVYKGVLLNGEEVAVKRLSSTSKQGLEEFINEVQLILKLQHKNLVRLLGFCIHGEEKLLIYEYMPNSSLDVFLVDIKKRALLDWSTRLNIVNGIARGMVYLHQDSRLKIIHRDLKPSNVLLDSDMNPKISDFGMARIFGGSDGESNTLKIVGTYGYMAPEFAMEGLYSIKSDVFSFGVLLLEIITGVKNAGFHLSQRAPSLVAYAWKLWNGGNCLELMDPLLKDSCSLDEFLRCVHIGLLCVQEDAYDRPTMSSVVVMLKGEAVALCQPERPAFSVGRLTNQNQTCYNNLSVNNLTISNIQPR